MTKREKELKRNKKKAQARRRARIDKLEFIEFAKALGEKELYVKRKNKDTGKIGYANLLNKSEEINLHYQIAALNKIVNNINAELGRKKKTKKKGVRYVDLSEFEEYQFFIPDKGKAEDLINKSSNDNIEELHAKLISDWHNLESKQVYSIYVDANNKIVAMLIKDSKDEDNEDE